MKFSIQEEGKEKQIFFTYYSASLATGIPSQNIHYVLKKKQTPVHCRRKDGVKFTIKNEEEKPFAKIDGKDYFSLEEIERDFGISHTLFFNQLAAKKNHFLDYQEKSHDVEKSDELEEFLSKLKHLRMCAKIQRQTGIRAHWRNENNTIIRPGFAPIQ